MTNPEAQALLVLAPDAFVRVGVRCPYCRRPLHAQWQWRIKVQLLDWGYECERCGASLDSNLRVVHRPVLFD